MRKLLTDKYFNGFLQVLDINLDSELQKIKSKDWTAEQFTFATAV